MYSPSEGHTKGHTGTKKQRKKVHDSLQQSTASISENH